ncbi:ecdysteroid kinase domain-containing protein [Ditylenchus destructor]|nr:ecdysteroid kinase domain-containing protein [Ditylenchus destructor]
MSGKDICGTNGITSKIYLISIELLQENGKSSDQQTFSVILKAFSPKRIDGMFKSVTNVNADGEVKNEKIECDFYSLFGNISKEIMPIPDIYYIQKTDMEKNTPGVIIMEDLSESGCMTSIYEGLNVQQVKTIVCHLAAFHHFLLCETDASWSEVFEKSSFENCEDYEQFFGDDMIEKVIEWNKDYFEIPLKKLKNVMNTKQMAYSFVTCAKELGLPQVLMHGDLHVNNLLWKKNADGSTPEKVAAFIDWQLVSKGNLAVDIARIVVCCEPEVRKKLESFILEYYYDEFSRRMHESGKSVGYGIEQLRKAYDYAFIIQGGMMGIVAKFVADMKKDESKENIERLTKIAKIAVEDAVVVAERTSQDWLI